MNQTMNRAMFHGAMSGHERGYSEFEPWQELATAIVRQAVNDYIHVLRKLWDQNASREQKRDFIAKKMEIEGFFHSDWYEALTDIDPDKLIAQCRIKAGEKERKMIERANRKKIKKLLKTVE